MAVRAASAAYLPRIRGGGITSAQAHRARVIQHIMAVRTPAVTACRFFRKLTAAGCSGSTWSSQSMHRAAMPASAPLQPLMQPLPPPLRPARLRLPLMALVAPQPFPLQLPELPQLLQRRLRRPRAGAGT